MAASRVRGLEHPVGRLGLNMFFYLSRHLSAVYSMLLARLGAGETGWREPAGWSFRVSRSGDVQPHWQWVGLSRCSGTAGHSPPGLASPEPQRCSGGRTATAHQLFVIACVPTDYPKAHPPLCVTPRELASFLGQWELLRRRGLWTKWEAEPPEK